MLPNDSNFITISLARALSAAGMFEQVRGRETWSGMTIVQRQQGIPTQFVRVCVCTNRGLQYTKHEHRTGRKLDLAPLSGEHVSWWGHQRELTYWADSYDTHTCASLPPAFSPDSQSLSLSFFIPLPPFLKSFLSFSFSSFVSFLSLSFSLPIFSSSALRLFRSVCLFLFFADRRGENGENRANGKAKYVRLTNIPCLISNVMFKILVQIQNRCDQQKKLF